MNEKGGTWSCCQSRGSAEESARTSRTSWCRCRTQTWCWNIYKLSTHIIHTNVDYLLANFIASSKCALVISGTRSSSSSTSMVVAPWQEQKQFNTNCSCLKFKGRILSSSVQHFSLLSKHKSQHTLPVPNKRSHGNKSAQITPVALEAHLEVVSFEAGFLAANSFYNTRFI